VCPACASQAAGHTPRRFFQYRRSAETDGYGFGGSLGYGGSTHTVTADPNFDVRGLGFIIADQGRWTEKGDGDH
jgi:hypothetical protein